MLLMDNMDKSVRGAKWVTALVGGPPLAVIPHFRTDEKVSGSAENENRGHAGRSRNRFADFSSGSLAMMPLDVLWFKSLRKVDSIMS